MCDELENNYDIEGSDESCEAPVITWEWNPGDVGEYGDGILVITARGDGFVMLEADERTRTGEDEAQMNIKADYGQTITAEAFIARAGTPVSPVTKVTIVVPGKDQPSEPTPPITRPSYEHKSAPVLIFADENDKKINEIYLDPGTKKTIRILLTEHPEAITRGFQAKWIMYDSSHQPTTDVTCTKSAPSNRWIYPLGPSTSDRTIGGLEGNTFTSTQPSNDPSAWCCAAYNSRLNQFWRPRDEFKVPAAVAEFTIKAPSDWKDDHATFELDTEYTLFVQASESDNDQYEARCDYNMVLAIKKIPTVDVPNNILPPEMNWKVDESGNYVDITATGQGKVKLVVDDSTSRIDNGSSTITIRYEEGVSHTAKACIVNDNGNPITEWAKITIPAKKPAADTTKTPVLVFADEAGKPIKEISMAPGEKKTVQMLLTSHPEAVTTGFSAQWNMLDPHRKATDAITCVIEEKAWLLPIGLSTSNPKEGGIRGNIMTSVNNEVGSWRCVCTNSWTNQFWYPRDSFMPPVTVAEFTIQAPDAWKDDYATFELDHGYTLFALTSETVSPQSTFYDSECKYDMVLTIINKNNNKKS